MIWLTWRQFRSGAMLVSVGLVLLAALLALTGPGLADDYASGVAACTGQEGGCVEFAHAFFRDHQTGFLAVTSLMLVLPPLLGLFWGAPLIARELDAGTHRLVWNQSVTRTRWLAAKLGLVGLAVVASVGLASIVVTWWAGSVDEAAAGDFPRMRPLLFAARGIVPVGYAAFAFALGVTAGLLIRRTVPAMAVTLVVFVALQIAMPTLLRAHLVAPKTSDVVIGTGNLEMFQAGPGGPIRVRATADDPGAWLLSSHTVDAAGREVAFVPLSTESGRCRPGLEGIDPCLAEIERLGYRQRVTYQPSSKFWLLQWIETGIYGVLALGLAGCCFWRIRRHVA
jgi:hypothetical protein